MASEEAQPERVRFQRDDPRRTARDDEVEEFTLPLSPADFLRVRGRCEQGEGQACTLMGLNLAVDESVKGKRAGKFFRKGCEGGDSNGCLMLSQMQLRGRVPGSKVAAARNSETACRMQNMDACYHYSILMFAGIGMKQDLRTGLGLMMNICDKGKHGQSCFQSARVVQGLKIEGTWQQSDEDTNTTIEVLLKRSCDNGFEEGCKKYEEFMAKFKGVGAGAGGDAPAAGGEKSE